MWTYLFYPENYWPYPYLYWPMIAAVGEECVTEVWVAAESRLPTGNPYERPEETGAPAGNDNDGPFSIWRPHGS